jgi:hypothetical protein
MGLMADEELSPLTRQRSNGGQGWELVLYIMQGAFFLDDGLLGFI